jgi:TfoX/Sxy family transcriptional regulator of competence genes
MSPRAAPAMPAHALAGYRAAVAATEGAELKGAAMPYTSVNGNMYSFLDKVGTLAIRLGDAERQAFSAQFGTGPYLHESGSFLKEYVAAPRALLANTKAASEWLRKSLAYAKTLKPKSTTKKKVA